MDEEWRAFQDGLAWRPISQYDRDRGDAVMLRDPLRNEAFGYWGARPADDDVPGGALAAPTWREAQETMDDAPLTFEPTEYAEVDDEWRIHLMAD